MPSPQLADPLYRVGASRCGWASVLRLDVEQEGDRHLLMTSVMTHSPVIMYSFGLTLVTMVACFRHSVSWLLASTNLRLGTRPDMFLQLPLRVEKGPAVGIASSPKRRRSRPHRGEER